MPLFYAKKKKKTLQVLSLPPDNLQPSPTGTSNPPPNLSLLEAEKLLCASLAPSKCTVFLENYSRKFSSRWRDAAAVAAANVHLCSGICTCVFRGWWSCLWRVFEWFDLSECLVMFKSCTFIKAFSSSWKHLENDTNTHQLTVSEGKMKPVDVFKMGGTRVDLKAEEKHKEANLSSLDTEWSNFLTCTPTK